MLGNKGICLCAGIPKEIFDNLNPKTKNYLRVSCSQEFKHLFGGSYEYEKARVKLFGFKTTHEYKNELARTNGFKNRWYQEKRAILKKYGTLKNYFDVLARKKGFKDYNDYQQKYRQKKNGIQRKREIKEMDE